jgi:uncharacterized protein (DUF1810 family)
VGVDDPFDLARFVEAQRSGYAGAVAELRRGHKVGHWIWYVFPQVAGLGSSPMSQRYAIASLAQAQAYLAHPDLGSRLVTCAQLLLSTQDRSAEQILGDIDAMKVRSSMTLFQRADPDEPAFRDVLDRFYDGVPDGRTLELLDAEPGPA